MIVCPICSAQELIGAIFCSSCGAQLVLPGGTDTTRIRTEAIGDIASDINQRATPQSDLKPVIAAPDACLKIIQTGDLIPVSLLEEVTLGRITEGQPIIPDIDLTPFHAYETGVSRMHASLHLSNDHLIVTDLGSANGTRLNGQQLTPHIQYTIHHGDILTLGKFKIQVLLTDT